jgi:zinc D-Ala-D-Ala carboxypeptidase
MRSLKLSKNFSLAEFFVTNTGLVNFPSTLQKFEMIYWNLKRTTRLILQPVRNHWGQVIVTSGYRNPEVNFSVGGEQYSQHLEGEACDFIVPGKNMKDVHLWMADNLMVYDQLIYEKSKKGNIWIHCSVTTGMENNRKQVFDIIK